MTSIDFTLLEPMGLSDGEEVAAEQLSPLLLYSLAVSAKRIADRLEQIDASALSIQTTVAPPSIKFSAGTSRRAPATADKRLPLPPGFIGWDGTDPVKHQASEKGTVSFSPVDPVVDLTTLLRDGRQRKMIAGTVAWKWGDKPKPDDVIGYRVIGDGSSSSGDGA